MKEENETAQRSDSVEGKAALERDDKLPPTPDSMLQMVLDTIPARVFWKDRESVYIGCNVLFAQDAGLSSPTEIFGMTDFDLPWVEQASRYRGDDQQVIQSGEPKLDFEEPQDRNDREQTWLRTSKIPLKNQFGEVVGVLGTYEDITDGKLAERALKASEGRYQNLVENAQDIIAQLSSNGLLISLNRAFELTTGFSRSKWLGRAFIELLHDDDKSRIEQSLHRVLAGEAVPPLELRLRSSGEELIDGEMTVVPVEAGASVAEGLLCILRNTSRRKRLESHFLQAQKMEAIGMLAGGVAHDFNNLLTGIMASAQLALVQSEDPEAAGRSLNQILDLADRGSRLTRQLLTFSRGHPSEPKTIRANEFVSQTTKMLRPLIGEHIDLNFVPDADPDWIRVDPSHFEQVLMNLAVNARDAMRDGGTLTIETSTVFVGTEDCLLRPDLKSGLYLSLSISDTGHGMDEQTRRRIFEPFFTTKPETDGTGLGLPTVHGIVKRHNGTISVYSEIGLGTTFRIYLPLVEKIAESRQEGTPVATQEEGGNETILIVEDEEALCTLIKKILEAQGYVVFTASEPAEALKLFKAKSDQIAMVISDVVMPGGKGPQLFESMIRIKPDLKGLLMSGYSDHAIAVMQKLRPGMPFIQKPFRPSELTRKIREILGVTN